MAIVMVVLSFGGLACLMLLARPAIAALAPLDAKEAAQRRG